MHATSPRMVVDRPSAPPNPSMKTILKVACFLGSSVLCHAQATLDAVRLRRTFKCTVQGSCYLSVHADVGAHVVADLFDAGSLVASVSLPMNLLGGGTTVLWDSSASGYLLVGTNISASAPYSRTGSIVLLAANAPVGGVGGSVSVLASEAYPGWDPGDVVIDPQTGAVLVNDYASARVMGVYRDSVLGQASIVQPSANWFPVVTAADLPILGSPISSCVLRLGLDDKRSKPVLRQPFEPVDHVITFDGSVFTVSSVPLELGDGFHLKGLPLIDSGSDPQFQFAGGGAGPISWKLSRSGAVVASGQLASGGWTSASGVAAVFHQYPGDKYELSTDAGPELLTFSPLVRYHAQASSVGCLVDNIVYDREAVGGRNFVTGVGLAVSVSGAINGSVALAFRNPVTGSDPLTTYQGMTVLNTGLVWDLPISSSGVGRCVGLDLPIPSGLNGLVLLEQYWFVMPNGSVSISDIIGVKIADIPSASSQAGQSSMQQGSAANSMSGSGAPLSGMAATLHLRQSVAGPWLSAPAAAIRRQQVVGQ